MENKYGEWRRGRASEGNDIFTGYRICGCIYWCWQLMLIHQTSHASTSSSFGLSAPTDIWAHLCKSFSIPWSFRTFFNLLNLQLDSRQPIKDSLVLFIQTSLALGCTTGNAVKMWRWLSWLDKCRSNHSSLQHIENFPFKIAIFNITNQR